MVNGICRFCGGEGQGESFDRWVRPTFTDHDKLLSGTIICNDCLFWFQEASESLARTTGKWWPTDDVAIAANEDRVNKFIKDKKRQPKPSELFSAGEQEGWYIPQRMRNYSHFIVRGAWRPFSKGQKPEMARLLTTTPFPELAVVAESGQKHIVFRARRNPIGSVAGWVQLEEDTVWVDPGQLRALLDTVEALMLGFGKGQIESGEYYQKNIMQFGFTRWHRLEQLVKPHRGGQLLRLALFLGQTPETEKEELPEKREAAPPPQAEIARPQQAVKQMSLF